MRPAGPPHACLQPPRPEPTAPAANAKATPRPAVPAGARGSGEHRPGGPLAGQRSPSSSRHRVTPPLLTCLPRQTRRRPPQQGRNEDMTTAAEAHSGTGDPRHRQGTPPVRRGSDWDIPKACLDSQRVGCPEALAEGRGHQVEGGLAGRPCQRPRERTPSPSTAQGARSRSEAAPPHPRPRSLRSRSLSPHSGAHCTGPAPARGK